MGNYQSSRNGEIDTSTMDLQYIYRALNKAQIEQNQDNINALNQELQDRGEQPIDTTTNTDGTDPTI